MIELSLPGAAVVFSTRQGGVSQGPFESLNLGLQTGDDDDAVARNRRRLAAAAGLAPEAVATGRQVHGAELREWSGPPAGGDPAPVDGHLTSADGVALMVLAADCLPLALAAPGMVAMLHCGWRGLAAGIVERALARFPEPPAAALGPAIGSCCYEVGEEVLAAFAPAGEVAEGRMLDLKAVARRKLAAGGVTSVEDVGHCTSCEEALFFSHRRDDGVTGRQGGLIWRT